MKQKHLSKPAAFQAALALFCLVAGTAASAESLYWYTTRDCSGDATFAASLKYVPGTSGAGSYRILGETECRPVDVIKAQQAARYAAHWPSWSYSYDFSTNTGIGYSGAGVTYVCPRAIPLQNGPAGDGLPRVP